MTALVKKEIRLLWPTFAVGGALTISNLFLPQKMGESGLVAAQLLLPFFFCPLVAVMLSLSSFGSEISSGTFPLLLAQPLPRQKIWETKVALLALALVVLGLLWGGFAIWRLKSIHYPFASLDVIGGVSLFGLAAFSGGLWAVLLLRQVAAAFWFTLLVPAALIALVACLPDGVPDEFGPVVVIIVLGLYSLAGFFFARWLFLRAQDAPWSGGAVALPELPGLARSQTAAGTRRGWRPRAALVWKELQFHQAPFLIAGALAVLHLGVLAARKVAHFHRNSTTEFILESVWLLWLVLPLLVGCAAVAEERRLGTIEGQLCLPVHRRTQFRVKLSVALGLSLVFGALMPVLFEGPRVFPAGPAALTLPRGWPASAAHTLFANCLAELYALFPLLSLCGLALLIGGMAFYVSTLTRNLLQTLAPAMAGILLAWFLIRVAMIPLEWRSGLEFLWRGPLVYFIALPMMVAAMLWLAARNYRHLQTDRSLIWRNLLILAGTLTLGAEVTVAVYDRFWDKLTPFEPPHGPARLTSSSPPRLEWQPQGAVLVGLPGGKTWTANFTDNWEEPSLFAILLGNFKVGLEGDRFLAGSNWVSVNSVLGALVAVKADGTLWTSESIPQWAPEVRQWRFIKNNPMRLVQFGTETNWSSAAPFQNSVVLVKTDGTLWRWGSDSFDFRHEKWPGLRAFTPRRLGTQSDWAGVQLDGYVLTLHKRDGSTWSTAGWPPGTLQIEPGFVVYSNPKGDFWRSTFINAAGRNFRVGVGQDGTLRIFGEEYWVTNQLGSYSSFWRSADLPIGTGTNWLAVARGGFNDFVTLKADGSLWQWKIHPIPFESDWNSESFYERRVRETIPVRLGTHSDWVAIAGSDRNLIALAADGSLWYWPVATADFDYYFADQEIGVEPLLDVSHKPRLIGNIFSAGTTRAL